MSPETKAPALACLLGVITVAAMIGMALLSGRPADHFTRDPLSVTDQPAYVGLLSNMGIVAWFTGAAISWMTAMILRTDEASGARSRGMFAAAAFIALLGFDDLFMLHEETLQRHLGISEKMTLAAYAGIACAIAAAFRQAWRESPWTWLIPAGVFFTASIAVDFFSTGFGWRLVIEDSLKFMGIVSVAAWTIATAQRWLVPRQAESINAA